MEHMTIKLTPADQEYRDAFIAEVRKLGITEKEATNAALNHFYDPKIEPPEAAQLYLSAKNRSTSLHRKEILVIR